MSCPQHLAAIECKGRGKRIENEVSREGLANMA
jgi:hypothetical protein